MAAGRSAVSMTVPNAGGAGRFAAAGGAGADEAAAIEGAGRATDSDAEPAVPAGTKMDSDSGDGLIEGFNNHSRETPAGMACRVEPILASVSAASLSARGT